MSFNSLLNSVCDIETRGISQDSATGEHCEIWTLASGAVACRLRSRSQSEKLSGRLEYQEADYALYLAWQEVDTAQSRAVIGGRAYEIIGSSDMGSKSKYLCLYLRLRT